MTQVQALKATDLLRDNLAVLRGFQPDVARLVESTQIPTGTRRAVGRDGTETFRVPDESGQMQWLGFTSMPTISSVELFANVRRNQGNVLLPGVLSGHEPLVVASRLAPFAAVFVLERFPALIRLAMSFCDYRDLIGDERLVFFCGENLTDVTVRFFEHHPGYEFPTHLFHTPHMTPAAGAAIHDAVERAGQVVLTQHATRVQQLQDRIAGQFADRLSLQQTLESPRIAVLSVEAGDASIKSVARVTHALESLGWDHKVCVPDAPQKCHAVARLEAIAEFAPQIVLFVNSTPTQSRELLPRSLPVVSWYLPGFLPAGLNSKSIGPGDLFVASTAQQERMIRGAGLPCLRVEPGADTPLFALPTDDSHAPRAESSIVILADPPPDRAEDVNLTLPSQIALWDALRNEAFMVTDRDVSTSAQEMLCTAEKRSGTALSDPRLRTTFEELLKTVLKPAASARACVAALRATGRRVAVYGNGWQREKLPCVTDRGPVPESDLLSEEFRRTQTVVFPVATDTAIQTALDALATGARVVIGATGRVLSNAYPGLGDVLAFVTTYQRTGELVRLLPEPATPRHVDAAATVARAHRMSDRLRQIVSRVQVDFEANRVSVS